MDDSLDAEASLLQLEELAAQMEGLEVSSESRELLEAAMQPTASAADGAADEAADGPASNKSLLEMISTQPQVGAVQRPWTADDNMLREADSQGLPGQLPEERPATAPVLPVKNVHRPEGNAVTPPTLGTGLKKHRGRGMPKAFDYPWLSKGGTGRTIPMQASAVPTRIARLRSAHAQAGRLAG